MFARRPRMNRRGVGGTAGEPILPADVSGLQLRLRGDLGVTLNGSNVSAWANQSGAANRDFSQGTAAKQPLWAGVSINGRQALDFDGTADTLVCAAFSSIASANHTIFIACSPDVTSGTLYYADWQTGRLICAQANGATTNVAYFNGGAWREAAAATAGAQVLRYELIAAASGRIYRNGTALGTTLSYSAVALGGAAAIGSDYTGGAGFIDGKIGEVLVYSPALSAADAAKVESYLRSYWRI